ncbi:hypothetical protein CVT25_004704 [Psilocybe cyanescens]|uniref:Uncharacterized protein n=1 Tax=Psilocybe cyanescens TaxID=93625 RepID=A0A409XIS7_PSICY|nr:hypothetical protein CVT25_004704 [Psilocybe cyanescens]
MDGFEIYVDTRHVDVNIGKIVLVKKPRVALDGLRCGYGCGAGAGEEGMMGEVTIAMKVGKEGEGLKEGQKKEGSGQAKEKTGEKEKEKEKWWTMIGRGRKGLRDKKEKKNKITQKLSSVPVIISLVIWTNE